MQRTKIETHDYVFNPVVGCDNKPRCPYCFASKIAARFHETFYGDYKPSEGYPGSKRAAKGFVPHLRKNILAQGAIPPVKHKRPFRIFVVSMGDLFCDGVPDEWINAVLKKCHENTRDQFFFLTKNPQRYLDVFPRIADVAGWKNMPVGYFSHNWYFGTSVDFLNGNIATDRLRILKTLSRQGVKTWASFEPLLGRVSHLHDCGDFDHLHWTVIGARTNPAKQPVEGDIKRLRWYLNGVPTWIKDNVKVDGIVNVKEPPR